MIPACLAVNPGADSTRLPRDGITGSISSRRVPAALRAGLGHFLTSEPLTFLTGAFWKDFPGKSPFSMLAALGFPPGVVLAVPRCVLTPGRGRDTKAPGASWCPKPGMGQEPSQLQQHLQDLTLSPAGRAQGSKGSTRSRIYPGNSGRSQRHQEKAPAPWAGLKLICWANFWAGLGVPGEAQQASEGL